MNFLNTKNKINKLKKTLVGGVATLTLVAAVACSSAADPTTGTQLTVVAEPTVEQVAINDVDTAVVTPEETLTQFDTVIVDESDSMDSEPIQAAFDGDGDTDDGPTGDALPQAPEVQEENERELSR